MPGLSNFDTRLTACQSRMCLTFVQYSLNCARCCFRCAGVDPDAEVEVVSIDDTIEEEATPAEERQAGKQDATKKTTTSKKAQPEGTEASED